MRSHHTISCTPPSHLQLLVVAEAVLVVVELVLAVLVGVGALWLAGIVAVREAIYLGATVIALFANPSYLLVDMGATWADGHEGWVGVLLYVLSPEKYVLMAAFKAPGAWASLALMLFDLAGAAAFVTAILPEEPFPPPLLVGYAVAALAMVTMPVVMLCAK